MPNAKPVTCTASVSSMGSQKQTGGCVFDKVAQQTLLITYDTQNLVRCVGNVVTNRETTEARRSVFTREYLGPWV